MISKERVNYFQEKAQEDMRQNQFSKKAETRAKGIYRLLYTLGIENSILNLIQGDISSGNIFNIFHLYGDFEPKDVGIVYEYYKEQHKAKQ